MPLKQSLKAFNLPIWLTWARIAAIPVVVLVYYLPTVHAHFIAALFFTLAALTDWLDGYIARSWLLTTKFGAFLDPVADKLLVAMSLVAIISQPYYVSLVLPVAVIIGREIVISALREWMAEVGKRTSVAVSYLGKVKSFFQLAAIGFLLWYHPGGYVWMKLLGMTLLWVSGVLTVWTMAVYLKTAWPDLTLSQES